jgi:hypothetical protein
MRARQEATERGLTGNRLSDDALARVHVSAHVGTLLPKLTARSYERSMNSTATTSRGVTTLPPPS